jgi:hypothetical protein
MSILEPIKIWHEQEAKNAISQAEGCRGLFSKLVIIYTELYFSLSLPTRVYLTFLILGTEYYTLNVYQNCFYNYVTCRHVDGAAFCVSNSEAVFATLSTFA